jgi:hypothetical protein
MIYVNPMQVDLSDDDDVEMDEGGEEEEDEKGGKKKKKKGGAMDKFVKKDLPIVTSRPGSAAAKPAPLKPAINKPKREEVSVDDFFSSMPSKPKKVSLV